MFVLNMYEQRSFANIWETPREQAMNDIELRDECLKYLDVIRGRTFVNKATKIPIVVNRMLRGEIIGKSHVNAITRRPIARIKLLALKNIQRFLTDSDPDEIPDNTRNILQPTDRRMGFESSSLFKYKCKINGRYFYVRIRTRKPYNCEDRLYFMYFEDITIQER